MPKKKKPTPKPTPKPAKGGFGSGLLDMFFGSKTVEKAPKPKQVEYKIGRDGKQIIPPKKKKKK